MLPRFEIVARRRPVAVVGTSLLSEEYDDSDGARRTGADGATPHVAPYAAVEVDLAVDPTGATVATGAPGAPGAPGTPSPQPGRLELALSGPDGTRLAVWLETADGRVGLTVTTGGRATGHRSRRYGRTETPPSRLGLALTGSHLSVLTREGGAWAVRGRVDLTDRVDTRDLAWLDGLRSSWSWSGRGPAPVTGWRAGDFGQLGLRDLRVVTRRDGTPYRPDGRLLLSATSAGPGFFDTAHTSLWALETESLVLHHCSDLYFRRPDAPGGYGDHAAHVLRDGDRWLVATSTWGDFRPPRSRRARDVRVAATLAETDADLTTGRHLLPTRPLDLPTAEPAVGVWDPHLVHTGEEWLVGYVTARRFFRFRPELASGRDLDHLTHRAAADGRTATEGTTVLRTDDGWRVLASDGRDGPRGRRQQYAVLDLGLRDQGTLRAPYLTNIPWPTVVPPEPGSDDAHLLVTFNGRPYGGKLAGYGTHGEVVIMRAVRD